MNDFASQSELSYEEAWERVPARVTSLQAGYRRLDKIVELNSGHPLDLTLFLRIAIGLTEALIEVHKRGLIHKDIRPANALVNEAGAIRLVGFDRASQLDRDGRSPLPPGVFVGSLAYMSPEQTGRMNRPMDTRSDLYSLGVMLYEVLTGRLPFTGAGQMEWIHCHLARQPFPPEQLAPGIPAAVSSIIMKLLAKESEARYQTAAGLRRDLARCINDLESNGCITSFAPGEQDKPDRLAIPERLHGRATESDVLLSSLDRVDAGPYPELVLVSGDAGIGKSFFVDAFRKRFVPCSARFVTVTVDPRKREMPYAPLAQVVEHLVCPLLAESDYEFKQWRDVIQEALGSDGEFLVDLVPALKHIVGKQPSVPKLPPSQAKHRLEQGFRRLIEVFAREHPLVLFLDDLQWLDEAAFDAVADLLKPPHMKHLMLIGAYRADAVGLKHPLIRRLRAVQSGAMVREIVLAPLAREELQSVIADSLHSEPDDVGALAEFVETRAAGNPHRAIQFLFTLIEEGSLSFDYGEGKWSWHSRRMTS